MFAPIEDEEQAEEHATEMGEMGNAIHRLEHPFEKFDGGIDDDEPFGLDRHKEVEVDAFIGKGHTESKQDAIDGTRSTYGEIHSRQKHIEQTRPDATHKIVDEETTSAPKVFEHISKHPQGKHIEKDVAKTAMHEHVGNELPRVELAAGERP